MSMKLLSIECQMFVKISVKLMWIECEITVNECEMNV